MTRHVLLDAQGRVAAQVAGYDPVRDNPDGALEAVPVKRFGDLATQDFDRASGGWRVNRERKATRAREHAATRMTRAELVARIEAIEARLAAMEAAETR